MNSIETKLSEVAKRIRELREIEGFSIEEMAQKTELSTEEYKNYENGSTDLPFTFIHKCALAFNIEMVDLIQGSSANLSSYQVVRGGNGQITVDEDGIMIKNLAPKFRNKLSEPYWVRYEYSEEQQNKPIHTTTHSGQEFDYIVSGRLKVQVGSHTEILSEGDSIFYDSSTEHGMIAVDDKPCTFLAIISAGEDTQDEKALGKTIAAARQSVSLLAEKFIKTTEDENGSLQTVRFEHENAYNFAFDTVDAIAENYPDKLAMLHIDKNHIERRFTYKDMKRASAQTANSFKRLGIKRGDRVMLVLKRHYQFWFSILALHKIGAIAIPATNQLLAHDFEYRFNAAGVSAIVCTADGDVANQAEEAFGTCPQVTTRILVGAKREGWHDFDEEYKLFSGKFEREENGPCGLFQGYYHDPERTQEVWHNGMYHTGDVAWRDEDGYFWYVSRVDDVIKSSGYRIGPFEIENVIMELPYVLECGVSAAPDEIRGQVVKASIVLTKGTEPTEELKKEIQTYVKTHTAPYKYPRIIVFRDELPKTISGKIQRNKL